MKILNAISFLDRTTNFFDIFKHFTFYNKIIRSFKLHAPMLNITKKSLMYKKITVFK